ncbi:MAG: hypothetical protein Q4B88_05450 [Moraxella sp.]|nr:hypothetical protein [Moraxella sp.]
MHSHLNTTLPTIILASIFLSGCTKNSTNPPHSHPVTEAPMHTQSQTYTSEYHSTALEIPHIGSVKLLAMSDDKPLIINEKAELWQLGDHAPLAQDVSETVAPAAGFGKVAFADKNGYFQLLADGTRHSSQVRLSPHSKMLMLPFAVIAVADENGTASLIRLELVGGEIKTTARFSPVLPDARPVQVNFSDDNAKGHIAIISHPDRHTYRHGVLGDDIEGGQLQFLERHSLTPLATPLILKGQVFEANTVEILPHATGNYLVTTTAGGGNGANTVIIDHAHDALKIIAQSTALPHHRWQSPFVFQGELYAVQMPHLAGKLVRYRKIGGHLKESHLADGYSNHAMGDFRTNVAVSTDNFALIPKMGYRAFGILDKKGKLTEFELPARIIDALHSQGTAYLLLDNGQIWTVSK